MPCQSNRFSLMMMMMMMMVFWPGVDAAKPSRHLLLHTNWSMSGPAAGAATPAWKRVMIKSSKRRAHTHNKPQQKQQQLLWFIFFRREPSSSSEEEEDQTTATSQKASGGGGWRSGSVPRVSATVRGVPERTAKCSPEASCFLDRSHQIYDWTRMLYVVSLLFFSFFFSLKWLHFFFKLIN